MQGAEAGPGVDRPAPVASVVAVLVALGAPATLATLVAVVARPRDVVAEALDGAAAAGHVERVEEPVLAWRATPDARPSTPELLHGQQAVAEHLWASVDPERPGPTALQAARRFIAAGIAHPAACLAAATHALQSGRVALVDGLVASALAASDDPGTTAQLLAVRGRAAGLLGRPDEAHQALIEAVMMAFQRDDPVVVARVGIAHQLGLRRLTDARVLRWVERMVGQLDRLPPSLRVEVLGHAAHALADVDPDRGWAVLTEADGLRHLADDDALFAVALGRARLARQRDLATFRDALVELDGLRGARPIAAVAAGVGRVAVGLSEGPRPVLDDGLGELRAALGSHPWFDAEVGLLAAELSVATFGGDAATAAAVARSPLWGPLSAAAPPAAALAVAVTVWEETVGPLGLDPAHRAKLGTADAADRDLLGMLRGCLRALDDERAAALQLRHGLTASALLTGDVDGTWGSVFELHVLAWAAGTAGLAPLATATANALLPHLDLMAVAFPSVAAGPVGLSVARARRAAGDVTAALDALDAAEGVCQLLRAPAWLVRVEIERARVADVVGDQDSAVRALLSARNTAEGHGLSRLRDAVDAAAERLRGDLPVLTEREGAVLSAAADGATNREIAARLGISAKTVEFHLSGAYRRLGAGNRTEAVTIARDLGILRD